MRARRSGVNPALEERRRGRHLGRMGTKDRERDERLAAALRENLKRRKAQARASKDEQKKPDPKP